MKFSSRKNCTMKPVPWDKNKSVVAKYFWACIFHWEEITLFTEFFRVNNTFNHTPTSFRTSHMVQQIVYKVLQSCDSLFLP